MRRLIANVERYARMYGGNTTARIAVNVLDSYYEFNRSRGCDVSDLQRKIRELKQLVATGARDEPRGGNLELTREQIRPRHT